MEIHAAEHIEENPGAPGTLLKTLLTSIGDT